MVRGDSSKPAILTSWMAKTSGNSRAAVSLFPTTRTGCEPTVLGRPYHGKTAHAINSAINGTPNDKYRSSIGELSNTAPNSISPIGGATAAANSSRIAGLALSGPRRATPTTSPADTTPTIASTARRLGPSQYKGSPPNTEAVWYSANRDKLGQSANGGN
jgi:hypothetical protein